MAIAPSTLRAVRVVLTLVAITTVGAATAAAQQQIPGVADAGDIRFAYNAQPLADKNAPGAGSNTPAGGSYVSYGVDYTFIFRGGTSYYNVPGESQLGGEFGAEGAMQLTGDWGMLGSVNANQIGGGTQFAGSMGVLKLPDPYGGGLLSPFSTSFFFDQFTDTRISGLYLTQMRVQGGCAWGPNLETGAIYTFPSGSDPNVLFTSPLFAPFTPTGMLRRSHNITGYAAGQIGALQWSAEAGHSFGPASLTVGSGLRLPLTSRVATFAGVNYAASRGAWSTAAGMEIRFGPSAIGTSYSPAARSVEPVQIARREESNIRLASVPGDPDDFQQPQGGVGEFNLDDFSGLNQPSSAPNGFFPNSTWTDRLFLNWAGYQPVISRANPHGLLFGAGAFTDDFLLVGQEVTPVGASTARFFPQDAFN